MTSPKFSLLLAVTVTGGLAQADTDSPVVGRNGAVEAPRSEVSLPMANPAAAPRFEGSSSRRTANLSLYSERTYQSLTSDRHLRSVGDLVTVMIVENASASSSADTGANRDATTGLSLSTPHFGKRAVGLGTTSDFSGGGRTERAGRLLAQLTVPVKQVLPNDDLLIGGEQVLEINGEKQVIRLEGRVRSRDVNELNTVPSSRVADARISFVGDGVLGEKQTPGWWQQLLGLFGF